MRLYQLHRLHFEAALFALRAQIADIAFAPESQGEIGANPQFFHSQMLDQLINELDSGQMSGFVVKWMGNDDVNAKLQQELGAFIRGRQIVSSFDLLQHFVWMRVKCQHDRLASGGVRTIYQSLNQLLLPQVYAIKYANAHKGISTQIRILQPAHMCHRKVSSILLTVILYRLA